MKSYMAYQIVAMAVTLNDLEGHSPVAGLFKCNPTNIRAAFYTILVSTGSVFARFLCISRASCLLRGMAGLPGGKARSVSSIVLRCRAAKLLKGNNASLWFRKFENFYN